MAQNKPIAKVFSSLTKVQILLASIIWTGLIVGCFFGPASFSDKIIVTMFGFALTPYLVIRVQTLLDKL